MDELAMTQGRTDIVHCGPSLDRVQRCWERFRNAFVSTGLLTCVSCLRGLGT
jgi:hypothetical protein